MFFDYLILIYLDIYISYAVLDYEIICGVFNEKFWVMSYSWDRELCFTLCLLKIFEQSTRYYICTCRTKFYLNFRIFGSDSIFKVFQVILSWLNQIIFRGLLYLLWTFLGNVVSLWNELFTSWQPRVLSDVDMIT